MIPAATRAPTSPAVARFVTAPAARTAPPGRIRPGGDGADAVAPPAGRPLLCTVTVAADRGGKGAVAVRFVQDGVEPAEVVVEVVRT